MQADGVRKPVAKLVKSFGPGRWPLVAETLDEFRYRAVHMTLKTAFGIDVEFWERIGLTLACITIPVLWGAIVNWLFNRWRDHRSDVKAEDESIFPDYQI